MMTAEPSWMLVEAGMERQRCSHSLESLHGRSARRAGWIRCSRALQADAEVHVAGPEAGERLQVPSALHRVWQHERGAEEFDADEEEHMRWVYDRACQRAEHFGIQAMLFMILSSCHSSASTV